MEKDGIDVVDGTTRDTIEHITKRCKQCQFNSQHPRRFKFSLRDDAKYKSSVNVDVFHIAGHVVLYVVDEDTIFGASSELHSVTSETVWSALRAFWIDVYLTPDLLIHDRGRNFMSREFKRKASTLDIRTKSIPVQAAHNILCSSVTMAL